MTAPGTSRESTPVDVIADDHLAACARRDPLFATEVGISGYDHLLTDFSPDATDERAETARETLRRLAEAPVTDHIDRVTVATMSDSLRREIALADAGERVGECNVIASPLQAVRDIFDLMPTGTSTEREAFVERLAGIDGCVGSMIAGLRHRVAHGPAPARRQVTLVIEQAAHAADAIATNTTAIESDDRLRAPLAAALADARSAFAGYAEFLRDTVLPASSPDDAVGRERYLRFLPSYLGADVDPDDAYVYGHERLASIIDEQQAIADTLVPGGSVADALAHLDADPRYQVDSGEAFVEWMQQTSDEAVEALAGTHFDIPDRLTRLECRLAPSSTGIIYYTQPSADLSRPGRMWWSVPPGQTVFHTWQEKTTVFHEGVPGHHLQLGSAIVSDELDDWRKLASFTSGHGEGWALYAERLMGDLGWLDDPGDRMGMLDSQRLRAARVVLDIGVHCGLPAPESLGGGIWDAEKAWEFLTSSVAMDRSVLRFELNRYLGWPGQAPSYALGQRVWEQTRDAAMAAHPDWTLKEFHTRALRLGGISLDVLRTEMTRD